MSRGDESAYPVPESSVSNVRPGMTIREAFAKAAMQGIISHGHSYDTHEELARGAIGWANALLAELEKPNATEPN